MPFPWRKTKGTRISQLVADHMHSSKHGGSLVVQTGFPTSLVDLFHKNRDRLKKPTKKKRCNGQDPVMIPPAVPLSPLNPNNSLNSNNSDLKLANSLKCSTQLANSPKCSPNQIGDVAVSGKHSVDKVIEECGETLDGDKVFVVVLKIFFVVVLALGTKRLVVGITVSALSLFFLEYVGKYVYRLLKPCSKIQKMLKMMVERVLCIKGDKLDGESIDSVCCGLVKGHDLDAPNAEMQIVQAESNLEPPVEEFRSVDCDKRWGIEEMDSKKGVMEKGEDCKCEVSESKHEGSRRAKMRSKMKKLVPKKFRKSKKKGPGLKSEVHDSMEEDKHEEQVYDKDVEQCESEELSILSSGGVMEGDKHEDISDTSYDSYDLLKRDSEASEVVAKLGSETEGTLGYWVLCLIVLAGLVGGRFLALVLTLFWCLMLKSRGKLRRCIKLPMVRSSAEISD